MLTRAVLEILFVLSKLGSTLLTTNSSYKALILFFVTEMTEIVTFLRVFHVLMFGENVWFVFPLFVFVLSQADR